MRALVINSKQAVGMILGATSYLLFFGLLSYAMNPDAFRCAMQEITFLMIPLAPLLRPLILLPRFWPKMRMRLPSGERANDARRTFLLTLAGFSFAAYFLLTVEAAKPENKAIDFSFGAYYMFVSFLMFLSAYLWESYKYTRWHEELCHSLVEIGRLALWLSAVAVVWQTPFSTRLKVVISVIAAVGWLLNFIVLFYLRWCFLAEKRVGRFFLSKP